MKKYRTIFKAQKQLKMYIDVEGIFQYIVNYLRCKNESEKQTEQIS